MAEDNMKDKSNIPWYEDKKNVEDLTEFLLSAGFIDDGETVLDIVENPQDYEEVWLLYNIHINGDVSNLEEEQIMEIHSEPIKRMSLFSKYFAS